MVEPHRPTSQNQIKDTRTS